MKNKENAKYVLPKGQIRGKLYNKSNEIFAVIIKIDGFYKTVQLCHLRTL